MDIREFVEASIHNDVKGVIQCLSEGMDPQSICVDCNESVYRPTTPFQEACDKFNVEVVKRMLENGADPNLVYNHPELRGESSNSPLATCVLSMHLRGGRVITEEINLNMYHTVKLLFEYGATNLNPRLFDRETMYKRCIDRELYAAELFKPNRNLTTPLSLKEFIYETSLRRITRLSKDIKSKPGNMGPKILSLNFKMNPSNSVSMESIDNEVLEYLGINTEDKMRNIQDYASQR